MKKGRALRRRYGRSAIDAAKIKRALSHVHKAERSSTNPEGYSRQDAAAHAIAAQRLNANEIDILLNTVARPEWRPAIIARAKALGAIG